MKAAVFFGEFANQIPREQSIDSEALLRDRKIFLVDFPDTQKIGRFDIAVYVNFDLDRIEASIRAIDPKEVWIAPEFYDHLATTFCGIKINSYSWVLFDSDLNDRFGADVVKTVRKYDALMEIIQHYGIHNLVTIGADLWAPSASLSAISKKTLDRLEWFSKSLNWIDVGSIYFNNVYAYMKLKDEFERRPSKTLDINDVRAIRAELDLALDRIPKAARKTWATLTSLGYEWGTINLIQAVLPKSAYGFIVLHNGDANTELISASLSAELVSRVYFVELPLLIRPQKNVSERYGNTLCKFYLWGMDVFERIAFLESDLLVKDEIDFMLEYESNETYSTHTHSSPLRSRSIQPGVISFSPSADGFNSLLNSVINNKNYGGQGDHGYFIDYFKSNWADVASNSAVYNWSQLHSAYDDDFVPGVKIAHLHGFKPWDRVVGRGAYLAMTMHHQEWFGVFTREQLIQFSIFQRRKAVYNEGHNYYRKYCS